MSAATEPGTQGWAYHNEDTGPEWSVNHPIESGECIDATEIKRSSFEKFEREFGPLHTHPDDAPKLDRAWFAEADLYKGDKLIRRGRKAEPLNGAIEVLRAVRACRSRCSGTSIQGHEYDGEAWSISGLTALLPDIDRVIAASGGKEAEQGSCNKGADQ